MVPIPFFNQEARAFRVEARRLNVIRKTGNPKEIKEAISFLKNQLRVLDAKAESIQETGSIYQKMNDEPILQREEKWIILQLRSFGVRISIRK